MNNLNIIILLNSLGYLAYASVLVYCSISNPPRENMVRFIRISTGILAIILGSNLLRIDNGQNILFVAFHSVFQMLVSLSAFQALKRKE